MAFETKEQVLEKIMAQDKPVCPHCGVEMSLWEVPRSTSATDWVGARPICTCASTTIVPCTCKAGKIWRKTYSHKASYRCLCYPGTTQFECMPVFSPMGGTGQIIDEEVVAQQEVLRENTKKGFNILASCIVDQDWVCVTRMLLDPTEPPRVRVKAAEIIGDYGNIDVVDAIRNFKFGNDILQKRADEALEQIHERSFTRECPFCAEIIKRKAKVCKHCGKEVAGL